MRFLNGKGRQLIQVNDGESNSPETNDIKNLKLQIFFLKQENLVIKSELHLQLHQKQVIIEKLLGTKIKLRITRSPVDYTYFFISN